MITIHAALEEWGAQCMMKRSSSIGCTREVKDRKNVVVQWALKSDGPGSVECALVFFFLRRRTGSAQRPACTRASCSLDSRVELLVVDHLIYKVVPVVNEYCFLISVSAILSKRVAWMCKLFGALPLLPPIKPRPPVPAPFRPTTLSLVLSLSLPPLLLHVLPTISLLARGCCRPRVIMFSGEKARHYFTRVCWKGKCKLLSFSTGQRRRNWSVGRSEARVTGNIREVSAICSQVLENWACRPWLNS